MAETLESQRTAALKRAERAVRHLRQRYGVEDAYVIGSVLRPGLYHAGSDIDVVVRGLPDRVLRRASREVSELCQPYQANLLNEAWLDRAALRVLREAGARPPYQIMRAELEWALRRIHRAVERLSVLRPGEGEEPDWERAFAIGGFLHDFYNAVERVLSSVARTVDGSLPTGPAWHAQLLEQLASPLPGVRPALLTPEMVEFLKAYKDFRHKFRYSPPDDLTWQDMADLLPWLGPLERDFGERVEAFLAEIEGGGDTSAGWG